MIPLCSAARTQDVVLGRLKAVHKAVPQNGPDAKTLKSKNVFAWFGSSSGHQTAPEAAMLNMLSISPQKRPIAVSAVAFGPPPFSARRRCKCNDPNTHPRPHTPRPLLTEF